MFVFIGKAVTLEKKVIVAHPMQNFVPVIPLQTGYGTKKFLFHSMIIMINYKRTSCILIFFLLEINIKEFLTMQLYDY